VKGLDAGFCVVLVDQTAKAVVHAAIGTDASQNEVSDIFILGRQATRRQAWGHDKACQKEITNAETQIRHRQPHNNSHGKHNSNKNNDEPDG
jgi:hypothetical protein